MKKAFSLEDTLITLLQVMVSHQESLQMILILHLQREHWLSILVHPMTILQEWHLSIV